MFRPLLAALVASMPLGATPSAELQAEPLQALPACIDVSTHARPGMGYDHLVTIANHCKSVADCQVSTNVNPQPIQASVPPDATHVVLTYRGSPAREFVAKVTCSLK
ncbi:MAG TPA: hypothetical protein VLC09_08510 [Polyangiaceae bacterium]|nr:hypothetical protein [Polyangiaceae bacterium]